MTATAKAPRERLTLRDTTDLLVALDAWIDEHIDELELNGGALPDDLAQLLDEILGARKDRADAIAAKLDELLGKATSAKATKDRAARREKVWNNTAAAIKLYVLHELERLDVSRLEGTSAVLRRQSNSAPAVEVRFDNEQLLAFADASVEVDPQHGGIMRYAPHPLASFITVTRTASIDKKAVGAAYEARRVQLETEAAQLLTEADIPEERLEAMGPNDPSGAVARAEEIARMRAIYVQHELADAFPGVSCTRGSHLRVD